MGYICELCGKDMEKHAKLLGMTPQALLRYHIEMAHHIKVARPESDKAIVAMVDNIYFHLKTTEGIEWTPIRKSLRRHLNNFIEENGLGADQHCFACLPEDAWKHPCD